LLSLKIERIASGSLDRTVRLWDTGTGNLLTELKGHTYQVNSVAFSPNQRFLGVAGRHLTIYTVSGVPVLELRGLTEKSARYAFGLDPVSGEPAIEFSGPEADSAREYPVCRMGAYSFLYDLRAGRFELAGFGESRFNGVSTDEIL